ncbi:MAG: tRNA (N6-isopentenyl adenosine(37)-C2)-methylthiotransferase MiaB [Candidatus Omnitrophica bacterium]|nr:tRNA (N6-isopentenyl adenosine(37)-C2)-methylthiotransferase MiaB [Candidatus Omnitrophota bacterium]
MKVDEKKGLKVAIPTFGCQMNEYDTQVAAGLLAHQGYTLVEDESEADIVLMNTCSVREHAEDRVFSRLGMLGKAKRGNPDLIVGLMGCMVEEHREKLFKRFPQLDLMIGTRNIKELPALIEEVASSRQQVARIKQDGISIEYTDLIQRDSKFHAWLPIMTGCNKVCTFCIVPITRGAEVSMPAREVYREASRLVGEGVKWITLLGQNVNSYYGAYYGGVTDSATLRQPGSHSNASSEFPELLDMLCQIEGLERISFTTSHPSDATEELFQVIAKNPKISRRFHLPLQSGSDKILKRMKRLHRYEDYKQKINRLRELVSDISITTDIIVGFSGEAEEDYEATRRAIEEIRYDGAYIFKYSVRAGTPAAKLPDDVPQEMKEKRHQDLLALQKEISMGKNRSWLGRTVQVFVEGQSARNADDLLGRTLQEKKVVFKGPCDLIGTTQSVTLHDVKNETFLGRLS